MKESKSGRNPGELKAKILAIAKENQTITRRDLAGLMPTINATSLLHQMRLNGHLILVSKGTVGRYAEPAVYRIKE